MRLEDKGADYLRAVACQRILDGNEVPQALGHFRSVYGQAAHEQPVIGERYTICRLALGNFAFIVWEDIVDTAAVNVESGTEIFAGHGRAFDEPTWVAGRTPRAFPLKNVFGVGALPQGEVFRVALTFAFQRARSRFLIADFTIG